MRGYRPPATPPRGKWARFLHEQHRQRDWSGTAGFEALREGLGLGPKSRTSYTDGLLTGKREPSPDEAAFLIRYFGTEPSDEPEPSPAPADSDLAAAIRAQATAIEKMAAALSANTEAVNVAALAVLTSQAELKGGQLELADLLARLADGETLAELARSIRGVPAQ